MISYKTKPDTDDSIFSSLNSIVRDFPDTTGQVDATHLREKHILNIMKSYKELPKNLILNIHKFVLDKRKNKTIGQRNLMREVKKKFNVNISENTISGWIHRNITPFENENTQFKAKPIPKKSKLINLYKNQGLSASEIAKIFNVSTITVINWLNKHGIKPRSHIQSMNTNKIKKILRTKKLIIPTNNYSKLTPEKAYVLGVLAGDGYINKKFLQLEIRRDKEFIAEFSRCLEKVYGIKYNFKYREPRNTYVLYAASEVICKDLLKFGNFKTFSWRAPSLVLKSRDKKLIKMYLRGLFDSEGSISKRDLTFSSVSKRGIMDVQSLLARLDINSRISLNRKKYYYLRLYSNCINKFRSEVGFTIKRKMERLK